MDNTYDTYVLVGTGILSSTESSMNARMFVGGTLDTTGEYNYTVKKAQAGSFTGGGSGYNDTYMTVIGSTYVPNSTDGTSAGFQLTFQNARSADFFPYYEGFGTSVATGTSWTFLMNGVLENKAALVTGMRFYGDSGTLDGEFILYGIKTS